MSSYKLIRWAADVEVSSTAEKVLLFVLVSHADRNGRISPGPSWATLEREATVSRATLYRAMKNLTRTDEAGAPLGLVEVLNKHRANGSHTSNDYRLRWEENPALPVSQRNRIRFQGDTGSGFTETPVSQGNRSDRFQGETGLTSENAVRFQGDTGSGFTAGPLEQEIKNSSGSVRAPAPARDTRAPARGNINTNDHSALKHRAESAGLTEAAVVLVDRWRGTHNDAPYSSNLYTRIGKAVQRLLDDGRPEDVVLEALVEWDRRDKAAPGLLPDLCDDVLKRRRAGTVTPLIQRDGTCSMPVALITDDMLTRRVLEDLLGPDMYPPYGSREVEEAEPEVRQAWYDAAGAKRLAERRAEARQQLARQQQKAGSA